MVIRDSHRPRVDSYDAIQCIDKTWRVWYYVSMNWDSGRVRFVGIGGKEK